MHSGLPVVHLDAKPGNVLINPGIRQVGLLDFGMVEQIGVRNLRFDQYVTAPYRAPELSPKASVPGVLLRPSPGGAAGRRHPKGRSQALPEWGKGRLEFRLCGLGIELPSHAQRRIP